MTPDAAPIVSERSVELLHGSIYVKQWSPRGLERDRCPIVLLHDSLGCVDLWREFPSKLAEQSLRTVIAFDRWGFGRSSERPDLPSPRFVSEEAELYFPRLVDNLGLREFVVMGHSVGGAMAVIIAATYPAECRAVITEAAQAFVETRTLAAIAHGEKHFSNPDEMAKLTKYHGSKAGWVLRAWVKTWLSAEFADWNLKSELPRVKCPLLAIHGDRDEYGSLAFPEVLSSMTQGYAEQMIVGDCGHVPHREREEPVLDKIKDFLDKALPAST